MADLFDVDRVTYHYRDREGNTVRRVSRTHDKVFPQSGKTKWQKGTSPLYRLPDVLQAVKAGEPVYFTEGEKDAETLRLLGVTATTTAGGASQPHFTDLSPLAGAEVRLIPDQDVEGQKYADKVKALLLASHAALVTTWRVKAGKDFADHYAAGFGLEDLEEEKLQDEEPPASGDRTEDREEDEPDEWGLVATPYSEIKMRSLHWLWDRRIEKGGLALLGGLQGTGKSTICCYLAAQVTHGRLEGESFGEPSAVLWITAEESKETAIKARLLAAGADMSKVYDVTMQSKVRGAERPVVLPVDIEKLRALILQTKAALVVIDPLLSLLNARTDSHKASDVRQSLDPLNRLAIDTETAVIGLMHERKSRTGTYLDRLLGSGAFSQVARSVLALAVDPEDLTRERLCLAVAKSNNAAKGVPTLSFVLQSQTVESDGAVNEVGKAVLLGETSVSITDLLVEEEDREEGDEALDWLRSYLEDRGGEALSSDIKRDCQKDGISYEVLKKRKKRLGIKAAKAAGTMSGKWLWSLPEAQAEDYEGSAGTGPDPEEAALQPACEITDCEELTVSLVKQDGRLWSLCLIHATDPALPLLLGGQQRLRGTA